MHPLIDNYTAFAENISGSAYSTISETINNYGPVSSIIFHVDVPDIPYLNEREIQLLQEYKLLQDGWDGDGAKAPTKRALMLASYLLKLLQSFGQKAFHVAPGPRGEIMIDLRNKYKSIELLFYGDKAKFVMFPDSSDPKQGTFELNMLPELIKWLNA